MHSVETAWAARTSMGVYQRTDSPYWWYHLEGTKIRTRTDFRIGATATTRRDSKALAVAVYLAAHNNVGRRRHRLPMPRQESLFKAYATAYESTIAGHKGADRERELLVPLRAFFDHKPLTAIDRELVSDYLQHRTTKQPGGPAVVSANTANREVDLLKMMLRDAVPKYLDASPLAGMKRLKTVKRPRRRLQPAQLEQLLAAAKPDPQDYALILLGEQLLVRLGDLLDLQRTDREGIWVTFPDPKNGVPLRLPLSVEAAHALQAIPDTGPYYFSKFRRAANPRDWRGSVNQRLEKLCAQCDPPIPHGLATGVTFHGATRKTGATRMLLHEQKPLSAVQRMGGWKTPRTLLAIYAEVEENDLLALVGRAPHKEKA